ncbi:MAG: OsmC family peroxiredoxin, partial [Solirubrobacteraceae bacterium]
PEELIAAAHASCFAMALSLMLGENHTPAERLTVSAACTLDDIGGAPQITTVELTIRARVPELTQASFEDTVARAADLCPVSNALRGNVAIAVRSELER